VKESDCMAKTDLVDTVKKLKTTDDEFTRRLIGFGLSKKEALLCLHLLKYGRKTPLLLAKSLKTYRGDVHRTLTSLIEKGMVRPSLDAISSKRSNMRSDTSSASRLAIRYERVHTCFTDCLIWLVPSFIGEEYTSEVLKWSLPEN
jgi:DNA-binding MarR family transcriptional regulator